MSRLGAVGGLWLTTFLKGLAFGVGVLYPGLRLSGMLGAFSNFGKCFCWRKIPGI